MKQFLNTVQSTALCHITSSPVPPVLSICYCKQRRFASQSYTDSLLGSPKVPHTPVSLGNAFTQGRFPGACKKTANEQLHTS